MPTNHSDDICKVSHKFRPSNAHNIRQTTMQTHIQNNKKRYVYIYIDKNQIKQ